MEEFLKGMGTFVREDWTLFRSLGTLGQKAGVAVHKLPQLVAKELADNALDAAGAVETGMLSNGFFVADAGPGLPGSDEEIADLFSIARPLRSTKLLRLPTRGALGNGLRVVAGAVVATGGNLDVSTCGRRLRLVPNDDGSTSVTRLGAWAGKGTRIDVRLGKALECTPAMLHWAALAALMAQGEEYKGKTSPHWYDADSFYELLMAAGGRPVRDLVSDLDGCTGAKAGEIAKTYLGRSCASLCRDEAENLLLTAQALAKPVNAKRLGRVGEAGNMPCSYASVDGELYINAARGTTGAIIPFVVEAWVDTDEQGSQDNINLHVFVNKTPITADVSCWHSDKQIVISGAGLKHYVAKCGRFKPVSIWLNIVTPYMPITSDGKAPDLLRMFSQITEVLERATSRAKRGRRQNGTDKAPSQKDVVYSKIDWARNHLSKNGQHRYDQRNMFYEIRPFLINDAGIKQPDYDYFSRILTDYENEHGDIPGMYRDNRGVLYHPHTGEIMQLGTRMVEQYKRPEWQFNKILYIEKEGFFSILIDEQWPEKHDCALLTSKGQATRAVKDLLDYLGDTGEDILFYCVHDADAAGTQIYQSLQDATPSRPGRKVQIINLGLEPWEAVDMGLQVEDLPESKQQKPYANYVPESWGTWLQTHRTELNVMGPALFIAWLDRKMEEYGAGKLIPPNEVAAIEYTKSAHDAIREILAERILKAAGIDALVAEHMKSITTPAALIGTIKDSVGSDPTQSWRDPVTKLAQSAAKHATNSAAGRVA